MAGIIWLASYPKSGNTWLRAFLANLFRNPDKPLHINDLPNYIFGDSVIEHYETLSGLSRDDLTPEKIGQLRPKVHEWLALSWPEDVFVKTHNIIVAIDGTSTITPGVTAGAIYVVRNPFDVAVSFAHHYQVDVDRAVDSICDKDYTLPPSSGLLPQYLSSWNNHVKCWTKAPGLTRHIMRFEDMRENPQGAFAALMRFLGLPEDLDRLQKAVRFSAFDELKSQENKEKFVESRPDGKVEFFRQGQTGTWREALDEKHIKQIVKSQSESLIAHGYMAPDGTLLV